jgi:hypothetical protein
MHTAKLGTFFNIPDLNFASTESNTDVCSISGPLDTADIGIRAGFQERTDSSGLG